MVHIICAVLLISEIVLISGVPDPLDELNLHIHLDDLESGAKKAPNSGVLPEDDEPSEDAAPVNHNRGLSDSSECQEINCASSFTNNRGVNQCCEIENLQINNGKKKEHYVEEESKETEEDDEEDDDGEKGEYTLSLQEEGLEDSRLRSSKSTFERAPKLQDSKPSGLTGRHLEQIPKGRVPKATFLPEDSRKTHPKKIILGDLSSENDFPDTGSNRISLMSDIIQDTNHDIPITVLSSSSFDDDETGRHTKFYSNPSRRHRDKDYQNRAANYDDTKMKQSPAQSIQIRQRRPNRGLELNTRKIIDKAKQNKPNDAVKEVLRTLSNVFGNRRVSQNDQELDGKGNQKNRRYGGSRIIGGVESYRS